MMDARQLRKDILARRDRIAPEQRTAKSLAIGASLLALPEVRDCGSVFIYVSFRSEVQTLPVIEALQARGKTVSVPFTRTAEKRLDIVVIDDPHKDLAPGYCNIPEPTDAYARQHAIDPAQLDLIILPGSVFDTRGGRFGYGGGYYDRLLEQIPAAQRIALAYDLQVVDRLDLQPHDQLLDRIVTESRVITVPSRPKT
ncbi:MAG: 5-formyltetrahydrofolate cyclo-ligase [Desulfofustis sp.]|jgi:5-formyltetrahydrofolate cyclo-ligase|nr:5-formyltetrahydrofolate cyclo-ligase [Desulfofustis sp.]